MQLHDSRVLITGGGSRIFAGMTIGRDETWLGEARSARELDRLSPGLLARMLACA